MCLRFAVICLKYLIGNKPISVFGLAHCWERDAIAKAYQTNYPAIREDMNVPLEQRGVLRFIQDHVVDLNLIDIPDPDQSECDKLTALQTASDRPNSTRTPFAVKSEA